MSNMKKFFLILSLSFIFDSIAGLKILGILPFPSNSHFNIGYAIVKTLHEAGHNVTVMSPYPRPQKLENFTDIDGSSILDSYKDG